MNAWQVVGFARARRTAKLALLVGRGARPGNLERHVQPVVLATDG